MATLPVVTLRFANTNFFRAKNFGPPRILVLTLLAVQDAGASVVSLALTDNFVFRLPAFVQLRALDFAAVG